MGESGMKLQVSTNIKLGLTELDEALLDARKHQAIAVYQNRAWKTLLRL